MGNYLCARGRKKRIVWVTELKKRTEDPIQQSILEYQPGLEEQQYYQKYPSRALPIHKLVEKSEIKHIQMTEVPKAFFTTVKKRKGLEMEFYDNLLQITERNHGIIFDLDSLNEVQAIEEID